MGLGDKRYGEVVAAFIRKHNGHEELTPEDIRSWVKTNLSNHLGMLCDMIPFLQDAYVE